MIKRCSALLTRGRRRAGVAMALACLVCACSPVQLSSPSSMPAVTSASAECGSLPATVQRDGEDWRRPARAVKATLQPDPDAAVGVRKRASVTLSSGAAMRLVVPPRGERSEAGGFAGFVAFRSGRAGDYRISIEDRAWIEVIAQASMSPAVVTQSDKRMRCFGVGKNLAFELMADTLYFVQLSAASRPAIGLLISPPGN